MSILQFSDGREWSIEFDRNGAEGPAEILVKHMFNSDGEETFDVTNVTHIVTDADTLLDLEPGDVLRFKLVDDNA